ncbi:hypothetical protein BDV29DRAFT_59725 [Aspergillus leporis]|uniref:Subtelomeric hrmA-associated cluster protein AFUB-079030/YDR124W-like helical bundle domain-containing protein n=1 Tax=Aspergillus leporis TaxID=41062 RepID=A0A5N5WKI6_9EURO|nr:hypothetical protein BDV29DRAFT_59725 [Aspergillus leporis]
MDTPSVQLFYPAQLFQQQGTWIIEDPVESTQRLIFRYQEVERIQLWYRSALSNLRLNNVEQITYNLIQYIEPHREELYPYKKAQRIPPWWPPRVPYGSPGWLKKEELISLIAHILFNPCPHGRLRPNQILFALKPARDNFSTAVARKILDAILCVRILEDSFLEHQQGLLGTGSTEQPPIRIWPHRFASNVNIPDVAYITLFGVYKSGRFFRHISKSLDHRNIILSDAEQSFKREVMRVEEEISK